ncbi:FHA domain-containing protein [Pseudoxanthomonas kalamensis]|uniref:FHA domain-containing protein n=1 Tax=Pseudoxanthomonas kalamensis TaxID=289483 RepID=UPI001FE5C5F0|nr:FHA domain-containing protein [Pseudoxanthomonas kalamensis]
MHRLVRRADGRLSFDDGGQGALCAQFCLDRRGLWLQIASGRNGVHVNGRPVVRMAALRAGDSVHVDGIELRVRADADVAGTRPAETVTEPCEACVVLRGIGGRHHGRSFTLDVPRRVGSDAEADIRIDVPGAGPRHALLEREQGRVRLRMLESGDCEVNGTPVREAWLASGDQVAFGSSHRFVVQVPWQSSPPLIATGPASGNEAAEPQVARPSARRWPWLLLSAALIALLLSALLLFGSG